MPHLKVFFRKWLFSFLSKVAFASLH